MLVDSLFHLAFRLEEAEVIVLVGSEFMLATIIKVYLMFLPF